MNGLTKTSTACGRQRLIHTNSTHSANTPCASRLWTYGTMLEAQETKKKMNIRIKMYICIKLQTKKKGLKGQN